MIDEQCSESADCGIVRPTPKRLLPPAGLTLRFSGSPTQLTIKAIQRRVRCERSAAGYHSSSAPLGISSLDAP